MPARPWQTQKLHFDTSICSTLSAVAASPSTARGRNLEHVCDHIPNLATRPPARGLGDNGRACGGLPVGRTGVRRKRSARCQTDASTQTPEAVRRLTILTSTRLATDQDPEFLRVVGMSMRGFVIAWKTSRAT